MPFRQTMCRTQNHFTVGYAKMFNPFSLLANRASPQINQSPLNNVETTEEKETRRFLLHVGAANSCVFNYWEKNAPTWNPHIPAGR